MLDADAALRLLERETFDAVLSDVRMPGKSGIDLLDAVGKRWADVPVILLTAYGTIPLAVDAMKRGAADFMLKPFDKDELLLALKKALLKSRHATPSALATTSFGLASAAMREVERVIALAAKGNATVLLRGETGTGKGLAARISTKRARGVSHRSSRSSAARSRSRSSRASCSDTRRARSPARRAASRGEWSSRRAGRSSSTRSATYRRRCRRSCYDSCKSAPTSDWAAERRWPPTCASSRRRTSRSRRWSRSARSARDLFYRLNVVPITMPPLRDRVDDVEALAHAFAARFGAMHGRSDAALSSGAIARLRMERWPGNVRQLVKR